MKSKYGKSIIAGAIGLGLAGIAIGATYGCEDFRINPRHNVEGIVVGEWRDYNNSKYHLVLNRTDLPAGKSEVVDFVVSGQQESIDSLDDQVNIGDEVTVEKVRFISKNGVLVHQYPTISPNQIKTNYDVR